MAKTQDTVIYLADRTGVGESPIERVFREHGAALRQFLRARLALEEDREDIIQELFLKLASIDNLEECLAAHSGSTRYYLFAIATNLIIDRSRRAASRRENCQDSYDDDLALTDHPTPEAMAMTREQVDTIVKILKNINPKYRKAFVLNRFKYKSYREIARQMGVSETTVERYIASALKSLRRGMA